MHPFFHTCTPLKYEVHTCKKRRNTTQRVYDTWTKYMHEQKKWIGLLIKRFKGNKIFIWGFNNFIFRHFFIKKIKKEKKKINSQNLFKNHLKNRSPQFKSWSSYSTICPYLIITLINDLLDNKRLHSSPLAFACMYFIHKRSTCMRNKGSSWFCKRFFF